MKRFAWIPETVRRYLRPGVNWYRSRQERKTNLRLVRSLDLKWSNRPDYHDYLVAQVTGSRRKQLHIASRRVAYLVGKLLQCDTQARKGRSVLCVGCRNAHELGVFRDAGFDNVVGIDLFSTDAAIVPMDMHVMTFPDNEFDVVFACHSLEHAYDPGAVLAEYARVLRDGGACIIEVPVRFEKSPTDLHDFGSLEGLQAACESFAGRVLFAEESEDGKCARVIFTARDPGDVEGYRGRGMQVARNSGPWGPQTPGR